MKEAKEAPKPIKRKQIRRKTEEVKIVMTVTRRKDHHVRRLEF